MRPTRLHPKGKKRPHRLVFFRAMIMGGHPDSNAERFISNLRTNFPISYTLVAANTGNQIQTSAQYASTSQDQAPLLFELNRSCPDIHLVPSDDMLARLFESVRPNRERLPDATFFFCDCHEPSSSTEQFMSHASQLAPGEMLFQDIVAHRVKEDLRIALRIGMLSSQAGDPLERYEGLREDKFKGVKLFDRLVERRVFRQGFKTKKAGWLFAPLRPKHNIEVPMTQGSPPPPELMNGLPIGLSLFDGTNTPISVPEEYLNQSIYTVGSTGSGKSTTIERIAKHYQHIVTMEHKGPLVARLIGLLSQPSLVFDPTQPQPFNILAHDSEQVISALGRLSEARWKNGGMGANTRLIFQNIIEAHKGLENITLQHVHAFLTNDAFQRRVLARDPALIESYNAMSRMIPHQSFAAVLNKVASFTSEPLLSSTCQINNQIDFEKIFTQQQNFLVDLSGLTPEQITDVGTLLFSLIARAAFKTGKKGREHTTLILDEFPLWAHEGLLSELLTQGRSTRTSVMLANQTLGGQLSRELLATILGNTAVKIVFRVEDMDAKILAGVLDVPARELSNLPPYHAYLKIGVLPAIKIHTLPPLTPANVEPIRLSAEPVTTNPLDYFTTQRRYDKL